jgi:hypothetical protein
MSNGNSLIRPGNKTLETVLKTDVSSMATTGCG